MAQVVETYFCNTNPCIKCCLVTRTHISGAVLHSMFIASRKVGCDGKRKVRVFTWFWRGALKTLNSPWRYKQDDERNLEKCILGQRNTLPLSYPTRKEKEALWLGILELGEAGIDIIDPWGAWDFRGPQGQTHKTSDRSGGLGLHPILQGSGKTTECNACLML